MSYFECLKQIDCKTEYLVSGYFREYQCILSGKNADNPYYNIPKLSLYVTLSYYAIIEYFEMVPDTVKLSEEKCCITYNSNNYHYNASYGKILIDPLTDRGIYKWSLKLKWIKTIVIALVSDTNCDKSIYQTTIGTPWYALSTSGSLDAEANKNKTFVMDRHYLKDGEKLRNGDVICLEFRLDSDKSYIKFHVNGIDKGIAFKSNEIQLNGDIKYRLAITMSNETDSVTIVEFKQQSLDSKM